MKKKKAAAATIPGTIELGDRVRFKINGFTGICDAFMEHLYQCRQVHIVSEELGADGKRQEGEWADEPWVEILEKGVYRPLAAVEVAGKAVSGAGFPRTAIRELPSGL